MQWNQFERLTTLLKHSLWCGQWSMQHNPYCSWKIRNTGTGKMLWRCFSDTQFSGMQCTVCIQWPDRAVLFELWALCLYSIIREEYVLAYVVYQEYLRGMMIREYMRIIHSRRERREKEIDGGNREILRKGTWLGADPGSFHCFFNRWNNFIQRIHWHSHFETLTTLIGDEIQGVRNGLILWIVGIDFCTAFPPMLAVSWNSTHWTNH